MRNCLKALAPLLLFTACAGLPAVSNETTIVCKTDDEKSEKVIRMLDQYAQGDLSFAEEMFADGVEFFWGTREEPFAIDEWREGITAQHSVFKDIRLVDRQVTTGTYPDGNTWTTVWAEWVGMNSVTNQESKYLIHLAYQWDGDLVAAEYGFFDRGRYEAEMEAAISQ